MLAPPAAAPVSIDGRQAGNTGVSGESAITVSKSKNERSSRQMTESESIFEKFLEKNELPFERIPVANTPRPDHFVTMGASKMVFEIKELSTDSNFSTDPKRTSTRILGQHIRVKVKEASKQIRFGAYQGLPSVLVLFNKFDPANGWALEEDDFRAAMYGERTLALDPVSGNIVDSFEGRNESFTGKKRTHFSALARLLRRGEQAKLTLFDNVFATTPVDYNSLPECLEVVRFEIVTPRAA